VSGFPGPHSYSEFAARERERDREAARQDVPPVERSAELHDITDYLGVRLSAIQHTRADRMTELDMHKTCDALRKAIERIVAQINEISQLRNQIRKAGTSEGK